VKRVGRGGEIAAKRVSLGLEPRGVAVDPRPLSGQRGVDVGGGQRSVGQPEHPTRRHADLDPEEAHGG
jgi:hypothetical protein